MEFNASTKYRSRQTDRERKESIDNFFDIIDFPKEWIEEETYSVMKELFYDNNKSYFKNFEKTNKYSGKFKFHFLKKDSNFLISPLFEYINLKKKIVKPPYRENPKFMYNVSQIFNFLFNEITLARIFCERVFMEREYYTKSILNFGMLYYSSFEESLPFGKLRNLGIFNEIFTINEERFISIEYFIDRILELTEEYQWKYRSLLRHEPFECFCDDIFDSLTRVFKCALSEIYKLLLENKKKDLNLLNSLLKDILEDEYDSKSNKNMRCKSATDTLYTYMYIYQKEINYSNEAKLYDDLLNENNEKEIIDIYKKIEKKPKEFFRIETDIELDFKTREFTKEELYNILVPNKSKTGEYSNFCRSIKRLDDFIKCANSLSISNIEKNELNKYNLLYEEFITNANVIVAEKRKLNKVVLDVVNGKKISRKEYSYLKLKIDKINFCYKYGIENYEEYAMFRKNILAILQKFSYERDGERLFSIMEKVLNLFKNLFLNEGLKVISIVPTEEGVNIKDGKAYY